MACINPNSPEFKSALEETGNPLLAEIDVDLEEPQKESLEQKLIDGFLKDFNITATQYDNLKEDVGIDGVTAADLVTKAIAYQKGESILPEVAYFAYSMLGKQNNKLRSELRYLINKWDKYNDRFNYHSNTLKNKQGFIKDKIEWKNKIRDLVILDFLKEKIKDHYENPQSFVKSLDTKWTKEDFSIWNKIMAWIEDLLSSYSSKYKSQKNKLSDIGLAIADEVLTQNYEYFKYDLKEDQIQKYYKNTIESDPFAKELVEFGQNKLGIVLTGSLALRRAGTVYRTADETLHDIDWVVPYELNSSSANENVLNNIKKYQGTDPTASAAMALSFVEDFDWFKKFKEKYPSFQLINGFYGGEHNNFESLTVQGVIDGKFYDSDGKHEEVYEYYKKDPETKKPIKVKETTLKKHKKGDWIKDTGYAIDFFIRLRPKQEEHENYFKLWKEIMIAKLQMGRDKDFSDWKAFVPYMKSKDSFNFGYEGFRHINFESSQNNAFEESSEKAQTFLQKEATDVSVASPKTIAIVKDFLKRIGVDIKGMQDIYVNGVKQNANGAALITQKLIQVVEGMENVALPEEAMHFAVEIIKQTNPKLYNQLLKEINNYNLYKQVIADYGTDPNYQGKDGKPDILKLKEEAIAKVLTETIINKNEGTTEKPENLAKVQSWWSSIIEWLKSLFVKSGFDKAAMDILSGKNIGSVEDIRAQQGTLFLQKSKQEDAVDKIKAIDARLTKKEVEENGEKQDRYFLDGTVKILKRVSDEIKDWYSRRFRGGEMLKSEFAKAVDGLKADKGTKGHADFEYLIRGLNDGRGGILVDENGKLRDEPLDDSSYVPQMDPNDPDREVYEILKENLLERLKSFPKDTVFLSEMQIYDPKTNKAGTIDLMAITSEGRINLLDWKFMALSDAYEDVPWYKVAAWKNQMDQYKTMLINAYGIKEEQFDQTRMIPIKVTYSQGNAKENILPTLTGVEIGAVNPKDIKDEYLIPVGLEEERTGNDDVDKLLKKLNADYKKLSEKSVLPSEKKAKAEQLNALFRAIRQLQMRQNLAPLLEQAKLFNNSIKNLMDRFNQNWKGKDPMSFSEKERNGFMKEISDAEKALSTYTTLDVDLADLFSEGEDVELENDLAKTVKMARSLENKLDRMSTEFVRDFIGKPEEVEDITKEEKTISGLAKWWSETATIQLNSAKILFRKANRALTFAAMDTVDQSRILQTMKEEYDAWAKSKGLTNKNYFDILKKKNSNELIDEFQSDFYKELQKRTNSKDPEIFQWIKENINISEYNAFLKEEIANEKQRIIDKYKDREISEQNEDAMNRELSKVDALYNTSTKESLGWYQYELIKKFPKEKWQTNEWKELHASGNEAALKFYNYIRERNEFYRSIGYLSRGEDRTFLPWIRKSLVEKLTMGGNISIGEQFLRSISMDEGDVGFGKIDPHTGRPIDTIPKYFTSEIEGETSNDLFKNMALYNEMAIKFKYLSDIEDQALALVDLERNKGTIRTSMFSRTKYKDGKIEISPDNSKNTELIESMVKGIIYGQKYLQNDTFDQALATFGKFGEKVNEKIGFKLFPEGLEGRQVSLNKSIDTLNRMFQTKVMGLNLLSATSNLFGGTAQSLINSGKYFTKSDYLAIEAWINSKMIGLGDLEYNKKAIGALDYFLPLTENYNRELVKKLSLNTITQERIQDFLFSLMRQSDKHVQTVNFYSFLKNTIVQDGQVVNVREYLKSTPEYSNFYEGTEKQRSDREAKFEEDVKKLIEEKGVLKLGQIIDNQFVIPGVDRKSESVVALRRKVQQISKDALGNTTEESRRLIDMNIYGNSFMMFKRWIPRLVDVRLGNIKYNSASDAYEWGRMRTVYSMLSLDVIKSVRRLKNTLVGNDDGVKYMKEMWEKKKTEYERETGKTLNMTESEFMDLTRRNIKSQMIDAMFFLMMIGLVLALKANAPDKDEDPMVKNQYKFLMKAADKLRDEIAYFYNPANLLQLVSGGIFPSIGMLTNFEKLLANFMEEMFGLALGKDEWVESAKPIKYLMRQFPVSNQIAQYMPMFVPDVAKDLGIQAQSQSGFIH